MQVNVETMFLAAKHAIPAMIRGRRRRHRQRVVDLGAEAARAHGLLRLQGRGHRAHPRHGRGPRPDGVRVNCVAPGPVYTPMVYQRGMSPEARDRRRRASTLAIEGTGWDIGHAVRFLLSDYARYITGHTLVVDGGATLSGPERAVRVTG